MSSRPLVLLTRLEAAKSLRIGLRTFDRKVRPNLVPVMIGSRVLFDERDIEQWAEEQKGRKSGGVAAGHTFASRGRERSIRKRSTPEMRAKLMTPPRVRTPMLSLVDGAPASADPDTSST